MRLFIGIPLTLEMKAEVGRFIEANRKYYSGYKWTVPENLHITLKFLGEVDPGKIDALCGQLQETTADLPQFSLALGRFGCFPNPRSPRVLWIGVTEGAEHLANLAGLVDAACVRLGFTAEDKPFRPHLTVARAGTNPFPAFAPDDHVNFGSQSIVHSYSLIESKLLRAGAQYQIIRNFMLLKSGDD